MELVLTHAPHDTVRGGGNAFAAQAVRSIGDGMPRTLAEKALTDTYPVTPITSTLTTPAPSLVGDTEAEDGEL